MTSPLAIIVATLVLGAGTFAMRFAGPLLHARLTMSPAANELVETTAVVLLTALVATAALTEGDSFVGLARPVGVMVGGVLAWYRAPFVAVVLAAAATAAGLRLVGVG